MSNPQTERDAAARALNLVHAYLTGDSPRLPEIVQEAAKDGPAALQMLIYQLADSCCQLAVINSGGDEQEAIGKLEAQIAEFTMNTPDSEKM